MMDQCQVRAWTCVHAPVEARLCSKCWLDVEVQNQTVVKQIQFIMNLIVMIISCINVEIRFLFKKKVNLMVLTLTPSSFSKTQVFAFHLVGNMTSAA